MIALVRTGRTPDELVKEFEPGGHTIRNWVNQAARNKGERKDGPTSEELTELRELRR